MSCATESGPEEYHSSGRFISVHREAAKHFLVFEAATARAANCDVDSASRLNDAAADRAIATSCASRLRGKPFHRTINAFLISAFFRFNSSASGASL
jgi:hypothetical protein